MVACRSRWQILSKHHPNPIEQEDEDIEEVICFTEKDDKKLVMAINDMCGADEYLMDWERLCQMFHGNITIEFLKCRFGIIKKQLPQSYLMEFPEVVEKLIEFYERKEATSEEGTVVNADENIYYIVDDSKNVITID